MHAADQLEHRANDLALELISQRRFCFLAEPVGHSINTRESAGVDEEELLFNPNSEFGRRPHSMPRSTVSKSNTTKGPSGMTEGSFSDEAPT